jgi:hypothetical protein
MVTSSYTETPANVFCLSVTEVGAFCLVKVFFGAVLRAFPHVIPPTFAIISTNDKGSLGCTLSY